MTTGQLAQMENQDQGTGKEVLHDYKNSHELANRNDYCAWPQAPIAFQVIHYFDGAVIAVPPLSYYAGQEASPSIGAETDLLAELRAWDMLSEEAWQAGDKALDSDS